MSMFHSEDVDTDVERMLCWGIVQSDAILSQVVGILSPNLFVAETTQCVVKWCIDYYHTYRHAPREHIFDILSEERKKYLREDTADMLMQQLEVISSIDDDTPNKDYVLKRVETYIKERAASMLCEDVSALLSKGQVQAAEERLVTYKCPSKPIAMGESIFSPDFWDEREEEKQELFHLGGALGDLVGPIERDSFISLIASEKIGKCIHSDSLVLLANGNLKPIWQVVRDRDEYVLSFDEEKRAFVPGRVVDWWDNGKKDCLRVRFKSGRIVTVTPNHPFLSPTGWRPIVEIGVGGFAANPKMSALQSVLKRVGGNWGQAEAVTDQRRIARVEILVEQSMLDDAVFWDEIVSVEDVPDAHTYDLSVECFHNFVADNCLVHNTWYLMYLALEAIKARRNVLFISAGDMTRKQVRARLKHMLTGRDPKKPRVLVRRPIMDCYYNQIGDCPLGKETSSLIGYEEGVNMEEFSDHRACHVCVSDPKNKKHYIGKPWYTMYDPGDLSIEEAYKQTQKRAMSSQFCVMCVPPRTLSVAQIEAQLDLYKQEGFVPDVIIVDYADILDDEPGSHKEDMRNRINISWMAMRRLSQERNCAFITATQAKVEARKKARVDQWDTSEDKRKLAHVTAMLALNQTPAEKREGIMRISVLAAREMDFDTEYNVEVLQCLELGKPVLCSYPHRDPPKENRKTSTNKERRNY